MKASILKSEFDPPTELIPHLVDHYAKTTPEEIYAEYPISPTSYDDGYRPITYRSFANAINGMAWWLIKTLGPGRGEILTYIGPHDVRYPALVLGAVKTGYSLFLTSPRNSVAAHQSLFQGLNCTKILAPSPCPAAVTAIREAIPMDIFEVPSVEHLLDIEHPHFEFLKTYPEHAEEKLVIVHTSGSTGIPKSIVYTHDAAVRHMRMNSLGPPDGFDGQTTWINGKREFVPLPPYHAAGLAHLLFFIPAKTTIICPTSSVPTAAGLVAASKKTRLDVAMVSPVMLQELAQNAELLEECSQNITRLMYSGGNLPDQLGDRIASKFKLANQFGATEVGMLNSIQSKRRDPQKDWQYTQFNPAVGPEFRRVTETEYELVIVRSPALEAHQFTFALFPELQEYHTRDLWRRHPDPDKADFWQWSARLDDVIVFLNGEKTNPISMEQAILCANPEVSVALVAGAQRFQASLLIELAEPISLNPAERAACIERIWPSIQEANTVCPAHARIAKTHVLFTRPEKPLPLSAKGIVQRSAALSLYREELDALYADADRLSSPADGESIGPGRVSDPQIVSDFIQHCVSTITEWDMNLHVSENWFHLGMDSLQAMTAARQLRQGFQIGYHSTHKQPTNHPRRNHTQTARRKIQPPTILPKPTNHHPNQSSPQSPPNHKKHTIILTGSTGTLGTYMLSILQNHPSVAHINCFNRKPTSQATQHQKSTLHHLLPPSQSQSLPLTTFHTIDLTHPTLNLDPKTYTTLQATTTLIIHNAWPVNFNLSLSSFTPQLAGVTNLINFVSSSPTPPHIFYISSISSVMNHHPSHIPIPEEIVHTPSPSKTGYADSKYISEHLLYHAARTHHVPVSIARVGQIAGAVHTPGIWNRDEWFPSLVRSSLEVGAVPRDIGPLGRVDWVPVDLVADVLVDLAVGDKGELEWYKGGGEVEVVSFGEWVGRVREVVEGVAERGGEAIRDEMEKNPAGKLLGFFEDAVSGCGDPGRVFETKRTAERSGKLRAVEGVKAEWVRKWVREWMGDVKERG
ncbi:NRPS-like enzyme [Aspergillus sclerotioniger CBS 115572]|uniref:NRPS-like enzyme n=1 Tax=Aspergillus sclerotioniger CBS 115572 TaxID=1450535 RepID=A0A317V4C9_9EURO|nr:NRPS-like enzyme [Aspergillus sclerotioniger CBS 115572]PWY68955.1 NRPS-like enzyme [Aspergillus sclerotioniger CBS 115572]